MVCLVCLRATGYSIHSSGKYRSVWLLDSGKHGSIISDSPLLPLENLACVCHDDIVSVLFCIIMPTRNTDMFTVGLKSLLCGLVGDCRRWSMWTSTVLATCCLKWHLEVSWKAPAAMHFPSSAQLSCVCSVYASSSLNLRNRPAA